MPGTGDRAPARMLVAVRAMAPVAGSPPKIGETTLAMPCATSSTLGLCLSPLMRSETTADSSDSRAPSSATVKRRRQQAEHEVRDGTAGRCSDGRPLGMPPKRLPIVSTSRPATRR